MAHRINQSRFLNMVKYFLQAALFAVLTAGMSSGALASVESKTWQKLATQHAVILFQDKEDLCVLNQKIQFECPQIALDQQAKIKRKVDALFARAQQILGMKGFVSPISVKIFKNRVQLDQAYQEMYRQKGKARAWYSHDTLTVYIQLNDINEGMLAHEFAHAIIDHYLIVPPPTESAEILARFVDKNLKKELRESLGYRQVMGYSKE